MTDQLSTISLQQLCDQENEPRVIIKAESPRFDIVVYNSLFAQISKTEGLELADQSIAEIQSWKTTNEDAALQIYDAIISAIRTKTVVRLPTVRYDLTTQNGTVIPSLWQAVYEPLLNAEGKVVYLLCTIHQVTQGEEYESMIIT